MKKIITLLLSITIITSIIPNVYASIYDIDEIIEDTQELLLSKIDNPTISQIGGDWTVLSLARSEENIDSSFFEKYYQNVVNTLKETNGILSDRKTTENSRVILTLSSIGKDVNDVLGYDLFEPFNKVTHVSAQGLNGLCYATLALTCNDYADDSLLSKYKDAILEYEDENGGFKFSTNEKNINIDVSAMALTALSNFKDDIEIQNVIDRTLNKLSILQENDGGYVSYGTESCETTAQVIIALTSLGIPYDDERFTKNDITLLDNLMSFYKENDGFSHDGSDSFDMMATEQALQALISIKRFEEGKNPIYKMKDAKSKIKFSKYEVTDDAIETIIQTALKDIDDVLCKDKINYLFSKGIINGTPDGYFYPDKTMSRSEFATLIVLALNLSDDTKEQIFSDVSSDKWYFNYINTAYKNGIIYGTGNNKFSPDNNVTNAEAYTMIIRALNKLKNVQTIDNDFARDVLSEFTDYTNVPSWSTTSVALVFYEKLVSNDKIEISPNKYITKSEIAEIIYNMLGNANKL